MNKLLTAYLILSFIGIALFGFSGLINHHSTFSECARALTNTMPCSTDDSFAMSVSHVQIYHGFSLAVTVLFTFFVGLFALLCINLINELTRFSVLRSANYNYAEDFSSPSEIKISRWFSILEYSEPRLNF